MLDEKQHEDLSLDMGPEREMITELTVQEGDITSDVCQRCANCCTIKVSIPRTTARYRKFLRGVGLNISPPADEITGDCCDRRHNATLEFGPCPHLEEKNLNGETLWSCKLYENGSKPQLCSDYNCVSWAKYSDKYNLKNKTLAAAQKAFDKSRNAKESS